MSVIIIEPKTVHFQRKTKLIIAEWENKPFRVNDECVDQSRGNAARWHSQAQWEFTADAYLSEH